MFLERYTVFSAIASYKDVNYCKSTIFFRATDFGSHHRLLDRPMVVKLMVIAGQLACFILVFLVGPSLKGSVKT